MPSITFSANDTDYITKLNQLVALLDDANARDVLPLYPAFLVGLSAQVDDVTGDGTLYDIAFNSEIFDQGGNYAASIFTAPATGKYRFDAIISIGGVAAGHILNALFVASNRSRSIFYGDASAIDDGSGNVIVNGSALIDMDAGDTCLVRLAVSGATKVVDIKTGTQFAGELVA